MIVKFFDRAKIKNRKHKEEMLSLDQGTICTVLGLYNIIQESPLEIAKEIGYKNKKGSRLLECLIWLQRRGWNKYAIEYFNLNGNEIIELFRDAYVDDTEVAIVSYRDHLASFYNKRAYGVKLKKEPCVLYTLKNYNVGNYNNLS